MLRVLYGGGMIYQYLDELRRLVKRKMVETTMITARQMKVGHETLRRFLDGENDVTVKTVVKVERWTQKVDMRKAYDNKG
jgi:hypothetical protein